MQLKTLRLLAEHLPDFMTFISCSSFQFRSLQFSSFISHILNIHKLIYFELHQFLDNEEDVHPDEEVDEQIVEDDQNQRLTRNRYPPS